jgi:hypothetical protein
MAEIRVQPRKRSYGWVWLVLLLIVVAAVVYFLYLSGTFSTADAAAGAQTWVASAASALNGSITGGSHGTA